MKSLPKKSIALVVSLAFILVSCTPDKVAPVFPNTDRGPTLAADEDPHPRPFPVCSGIDTILLMSEDGSFNVNRCYHLGDTVPCGPNEGPWGFVEIMNGPATMVANFTLEPGWYVDTSRSRFATAGNFTFINGIPVVNNDWRFDDVNPVVNKWQLVAFLVDLPSPCFEIALNLTIVKLSIFGMPIPDSEVSLWGFNRHSNDPFHPTYSPDSPLLTHWCPVLCPNDGPTPDTLCAMSYVGVPGQGGCAVLQATYPGGSGPVSFVWSNGDITPTTQVCPTSDTEYRVTVTDITGEPIAINVFNVFVVDVNCGAGNSPAHKVKVCHLPPGNPANMQDICIDWRGVPAHVGRFRIPGTNSPNGHNSGCDIGGCGTNRCL